MDLIPFFVPQIGESYHSTHGAIQESQHVFIQSGLSQINKETIRIFEMGFGSGLNTLLSWDYSNAKSLNIVYETIELYPIGIDEARQINYPGLLGFPADHFLSLHAAEWGIWNEFAPNFSFRKFNTDLKAFSPLERYDLIYFDAFSPEVQPDLWETPIFNTLFQAMNPGGILTSYSARGDFRRALLQVGFKVEKIPGPPGKRHITRAWKENK